MESRLRVVSLPWKLVLIALFLFGMSLALHEKLERRRSERSAIRELISQGLTSSDPVSRVAG